MAKCYLCRSKLSNNFTSFRSISSKSSLRTWSDSFF
nr:MAG TPA: hypothetical protein [Crassvirales sp.]